MAAMANPPKACLTALQDSVESDGFDWVLTEETHALLPLMLGVTFSLYFSFKSILTFGLYLNELIAIVAKGGIAGDKAIFKAVKIDPTVIACKNVTSRISRSILEDDQKFLKKLRQSFQGKFTKRESRVYQLQRLILQVLLETNSPKLGSEHLYELFVEQLKIASRDNNSDIGDVANNLRQFAYQFIKRKSVSET